MWYGTPRGAYSGCYVSSGLHLRVTNAHYRADNGGEIMGVKDEVVYLGDNANLSETTAKAKENYKFTTWTADRDVTLNDGSIITAGTEMSGEQVGQSVIDRETTFTAHFNKTVGSLKVIKESR